MRAWMTALAFAGAASLWAPSALPCGGGFGTGLTIGESQKIFIAHKNSVETYFFSPHFCGKAAAFGLILPVPSTLSSNPRLGESTLITEIEDITKPTVRVEQVCESDLRGSGNGGMSDAGYNGAAGHNQGVTEVDKGQVGIFDWSLLKADTAKAFTDWLDANQYPYDPKLTAPFQYYVDSGWYFVAFKVTADTQDPPSNMLLCGDLGPLTLSFSAQAPVVPTRILAAGNSNPYTQYGWRFFVVADKQQTATTGELHPTLRYSGAVTADDLSAHAAFGNLASAGVVAAGDWLTEFDVSFYPQQMVSDIEMSAAPSQQAYRREVVQTVVVDCTQAEVGGGGCAIPRRTSAGGAIGVMLTLGALVARRRRSR